MHWKSYGIIVETKNFNNTQQIITVISKLGKWKGLYNQKQGNITLFSQCICNWEGKNATSIGSWFFSDISHLSLNNNNNNDRNKYYSYLTCLYICYLIKHYIPEQFPCKDNLETLIYVKDRLIEHDWQNALIEFESYLTQEPQPKHITKHTTQLFFEKTIKKFRQQYQTEPNTNMRNILLKYIIEI